jgi:hypothetical protein
MWVRKVRIENLRAIRDPVELDFSAAIEVLHGENNSGKSSILMGVALGLYLLGLPEVWGAGEDGGGDETEGLLDGVSVTLPARFVKVAAHRQRQDEPVRITLWLGAAGVVEASFELSRPQGISDRSSRSWLVRSCLTGTQGVPVPIAWELVGAERSTDGGDEGFIRASRDSEDAAARRRFYAVEKALRVYAPELGEGRLEVVEADRRQELAWVSDDGTARRFADEGSGLRSIKDILVGTFGSAAGVLLVEEPEVHLTANSVGRLRDLFLRLVQPGRQLLLSSHVYSFDGEDVWRVWREGDTTRVSRDRTTPDDRDPVSEDEQERRLQRLYGQAGRPHPGFVSRDGVTQLPLALLDELQVPTGVAWAKVKDGAYAMVTLRTLRDAEDGDTKGGS